MIEQEIKFLLNPNQANKIRRKIEVLAEAKFASKNYERTTMFESELGLMKNDDARLRLREIRDKNNNIEPTKLELSYKRRIHAKDRIKKEEEIETSFVANSKTFYKILEKMGYIPVTSYERWRATYMLRKAKITLDELPFGYVLEIEASRPDIESVTKQLELNPYDSYPKSMDDVYEDLCKGNGIRPKAHIRFSDRAMPKIK